MDRTLILVKPDAFARNLTGEIITRFERKGLRLVALKLMRLDEPTAKVHYAEHEGKPFFDDLVAFITSGPLVAMIVEGPQAIEASRQLIGSTSGIQAAPGSIRGDYAIGTRRNLVHGSDSAESAEREIAIYFAGETLFVTTSTAKRSWADMRCGFGGSAFDGLRGRRPPGCTRLVLAGCAAALVLSACGGGNGDDERAKGPSGPAYDADRLARQAAGPNVAARSGVIDGSVQITLEGVPEFAEPFSASVSGPYQYRKGAALPDYELEMGVRDHGVELSSVRGKSYVSLGETGYAMPPAARQRLVRGAARGRNGLTRTLEQFGISPSRWETDRRVGGTERVGGAEVVRIDTSFNAGRILKDANTLMGVLRELGILRAVGLPPQITRNARKLVVRSVTSKVGASWIAPSDKTLRQAGFTMRFAVAKGDRAALGGISGGTVVGRLTVSEVGKRQRIKPPQTVSPYAEFALALDALAEAQG